MQNQKISIIRFMIDIKMTILQKLRNELFSSLYKILNIFFGKLLFSRLYKFLIKHCYNCTDYKFAIAQLAFKAAHFLTNVFKRVFLLADSSFILCDDRNY